MAFKHKGATSFPIESKPRDFNFSVTAEDEKLLIWLEDCVTKEQWVTKALGLSEFVTLETAIPQAKVANYAARIVHILAPASEDDHPTRSLSRPSADGSRVLCVGYTLQTTDFTTVLEYSFTLAAVPLEPTDLLEARMRDLEEMVSSKITRMKDLEDMMQVKDTEIQGLRNEIKELKVSPPAIEELERRITAVAAENVRLQGEVTEMKKTSGAKAYAEFNAAANTSQQQAIAWTPTGHVDASEFKVDKKQGQKLVVVEGGVYTVFVSILHASGSYNTPQIEVMLDGKSLRSLNDNNNSGCIRQSTMMIRTTIRANSYLQVFYRGNGYAYPGSTITILQESKLSGV